jgi:hypothetical protein
VPVVVVFSASGVRATSFYGSQNLPGDDMAGFNFHEIDADAETHEDSEKFHNLSSNRKLGGYPV